MQMHKNWGSAPVVAGKPSAAKLTFPVKFAGLAVRGVFLIVLVAVTARAASPQTETLWSVLETPGDLIRVAVGFVACAWFTAHIFIPPRDPGAYKIWLYLGPAILPFAVLCAVVVW
jgi:hypothetical protein